MLTHCKLTRKQQLKLLEFFVCEVTARTAANMIDINYHSVHLFYTKIRRIIAENQKSDTPFQGTVEVDESYFGGVRKGKRGRGAAGKIPVFGLQLSKRARSDKRDGKVYACMVKDTKSGSLMPIIKFSQEGGQQQRGVTVLLFSDDSAYFRIENLRSSIIYSYYFHCSSHSQFIDKKL